MGFTYGRSWSLLPANPPSSASTTAGAHPRASDRDGFKDHALQEPHSRATSRACRSADPAYDGADGQLDPRDGGAGQEEADGRVRVRLVRLGPEREDRG